MEEKVEKKPRKKGFLIAVSCGLLAVIILIVLLLTQCDSGNDQSTNGDELAKKLASPDDATITLDEDIFIDGPLVVKGNKTLTGKGTITLVGELEGKWPDADLPTWGMGCAKLKAGDASTMGAMLHVEPDASLTLDGDVIVDAVQKGNGITVDGALTVGGSAIVRNGRYANLVISGPGKAKLASGQLLDGSMYNVINDGELDLTGTTVSGAKGGASIYTTGIAKQSGGTVANAFFHNVYVADGSFTMTGGINDGAAKDGIVAAEDANVQVIGGTITNCNHGLCNNGSMEAGAVILSECGIMNYETGILDLKGTTVDTSEVYCLANNGGRVTAEKFSALKCDTCAVYNFSGEMILTDLTVSGSRDGNLSNVGGNMNVNGASLGVCRDKAVTVGNGSVTLDHVTIEGTTNDKYGVYSFGGELIINNSSMKDISSTAVKVDAGGTVELNDVTMTDVAQNGLQSDGGKIVANGLTMVNMGSHGIYNNGGEIIVQDLSIDTVKKNAIQHKYGATAIDGVEVKNTGNHGAYVESGLLTVKNGSFTTMAANGFYLPEGDAQLILESLTVSGAVQQGVNNQGTVDIRNVTITDTDMNGIYNKPGGVVTIDGLIISDVNEHGINNKAQMTVKNVTVTNTGAGSNGIQNNGTMELIKASISGSKNHGLYNTGVLIALDMTVDGTSENGIYNDKGNVTINGLTVKSSAGQGVNTSGIIDLKNVEIFNAGKNGIYISAGSAQIDTLTIDGVKEHGINNKAELELFNAHIVNTGAEKNGIQNNGTMKATACTITGSKNHGIYNNGILTAADITIDGVENNGIYNDKGTITSMLRLYISNADQQGVNNTGTFDASDVTITATGKNGVYNNHGIANINGLTVIDPGEHGISNDYEGVVVLKDATLIGSGMGSNCIQNKADMTLINVTASASSNHGVYNSAALKTEGTLTIKDAAVNGIYNYGGDVVLDHTVISGSGEHGVNNAGILTGKTFRITGVAANGIQNNGTMTVTVSAHITESGKHGMYNGKVFEGVDITIFSAYDLLMSNSGSLVIRGLELTGTAHKALYNNGYAELYDADVDGAQVTNGGSAEYLLDVNGGVLDLTDCTILNASGTALHLRGKGFASVTNVIIDHVGNYGVFVEGGSTVSGDGLVINNVTKGGAVSGSEGIAIKLAGTVTMMDHVTLGAYDDAVTGSGKQIDQSVSGLASTALQLDATNASYSGYDLSIIGTTANAIYNKGQLYITDLYAEGTKHGLVCRYNGWATLSGTVKLQDMSGNPITIYGPESGSNRNGVTVLSGTALTLENAGSHAINNKGSFLAAADTTLIVKNVVGKNVNAINNQKGATMTLGDVIVDGVYVNITMYNETTINSNSGNGLMNSGELELNGDVVISNIFYKAENGKTDNSNGAGLVAKNAGAITGTGSITVIGSQTAPLAYAGYAGLFNGIFITKRTVEIGGDIYVEGAKNQGVYVADADASLSSGNITVKDIGGNGIYINKDSAKLTVSGTIIVEDAGQHGVNNNGTVTAGSITVQNAGTTNGHNGINNNGGTVHVSNAVVVKDIGAHGVSNNSVFTAASITATGVGLKNASNGVQNSGNADMDISGAVVVDKATGHGIYNAKSASFGSFTAQNVSKCGINNGGELTVTGAITIRGAGEKGIANTKNIKAGSISIKNVETSYGLHSKGGSVKADMIQIDGVDNNIGIYMEGNTTIEAGTVAVVGTKGQCIQMQHANTFKADTLIVAGSTNGNGVRLYNKSGQPTVTIGTMIAYKCAQRGLSADYAITTDHLNVTTLYWSECSEAVKGNIRSCVGTVIDQIPSELIPAEADASAGDANEETGG